MVRVASFTCSSGITSVVSYAPNALHSLPQVDEAITSKIVTAQSIETKLLEQQMRQARNHHRSLMTHY